MKSNHQDRRECMVVIVVLLVLSAVTSGCGPSAMRINSSESDADIRQRILLHTPAGTSGVDSLEWICGTYIANKPCKCTPSTWTRSLRRQTQAPVSPERMTAQSARS